MALFSVADIVTALFLLIAVAGAIIRHDGRKSSQALTITMIVSIIMVLLDSTSGYQYGAGTPSLVLYITVVFSALATKGILLAFYNYCFQYFSERTSISKWLFIVPVVLLVLTMVVHAVMVFMFDVVTLDNGSIVIDGSMHPLIKLASVVLPLYLPVLALIKRKEVGADAVLVAGAPAVFGILISFIGLHDFGTCAAAIVIFFTYVFLQNSIFNAREQSQKTLEASNTELEALNAELEKRQTQLEEATSEQEAQIEEIAALNSELEERQAQLEEVTTEQEAQLEEISALNDELETSRENMSEAYGMIEGLSQEYHTIWVVNKDTSKMRLVRSSGKSTIQNAVQMGKDMPEFDVGFNSYIETYVEPQDRERMHREIAFAEILRQLEKHPNDAYRVNYLRRTDDGQIGYHQIAFVNADTKDGHQRFVYGFRDVDALVKEEHEKQEVLRQARDAANAANNAKTSFLFNMSHDIRTPMNAIMGFSDLMEKHMDDQEKCTEYLQKIQDSSKVLLSIINNVLDMARIEKGATNIEETAWSAELFNDTIYSVFSEMMEEKGIEFVRAVNVEHNYIFCDATKMTQIFNNILSNAYKYTNPGGRVEMRLEELPSDREGYALYRTTISDNGIGMEADFLPHLFEEFSREHTSTETKVEGTGLGMPIVKRLIDLMGGTIEVTSEKGVGTTFVVRVYHRIAEKSDLVQVDAAQLEEDAFAGKRILLAEDNDLNAEIAMEILGEAGFQIDRAEDGQVCVNMLNAAESGYYDVILMDVQMPNMNGYEATQAIRELGDERKKSIPILAMTANAFEEDRRAALHAGMNGHIAKPIDVSELLKALADALK